MEVPDCRVRPYAPRGWPGTAAAQKTIGRVTVGPEMKLMVTASLMTRALVQHSYWRVTGPPPVTVIFDFRRTDGLACTRRLLGSIAPGALIEGTVILKGSLLKAGTLMKVTGGWDDTRRGGTELLRSVDGPGTLVVGTQPDVSDVIGMSDYFGSLRPRFTPIRASRLLQTDDVIPTLVVYNTLPLKTHLAEACSANLFGETPPLVFVPVDRATASLVHSERLSATAIVGIAIGSAVVAALLAVGLFLVCRRRGSSSSTAEYPAAFAVENAPNVGSECVTEINPFVETESIFEPTEIQGDVQGLVME